MTQGSIYDCECLEKELRVKITSNGVKQYKHQCLACGRVGKNLKTADALNELEGEEPNEVDEGLKRRFFDERGSIKTAQYHEEKRLWWERYNEYLNSDEWKIRRDRVLKRDCYICQACLQRRATQVHHKTYENVGCEPAFDLIAICSTCHEFLHHKENTSNGVEGQ